MAARYKYRLLYNVAQEYRYQVYGICMSVHHGIRTQPILAGLTEKGIIQHGLVELTEAKRTRSTRIPLDATVGFIFDRYLYNYADMQNTVCLTSNRKVSLLIIIWRKTGIV